MDTGFSGQATHTEGQRKSDPGGNVLASNMSEIRHRRLLSTLNDLTDPEVETLKRAIERNRVAGSFHERLTASNGFG